MASTTSTIRIHSALREIPRETWDELANPGWNGTIGGSGEPARQAPVDSNPEDQVGAKKESIFKQFETIPESVCKPVESVCATSESNPQKEPYNPFISYDFLSSLEESGCARPETGWAPCHLALEDACGTVSGVVPAYLKNHSQGEFVFDYGWADAFERAGGEYYPKIQISVPFTPATGKRLLVGNAPGGGERRALLAAGIQQATRQFGASSAHLTFLTSDEASLLEDTGYLHRTDQQFHWTNDGYRTFEEFLTALSSRKRKTIKRERRDAAAGDIDIDWVTGSNICEHHWDTFFHFYMDTGSRKWGHPYLNRVFFSLIGERMADRILLVFARRGGEIIGGALNFIGSDTLYGRYWGAREHLPFLHFEVCYYQAIDFAIANGLKYVEAGAQGTHKLARGYLPVTTHSAHFIAHAGFPRRDRPFS